MTNGLQAVAARAVDWLTRYALPLWSDPGFAAGPDYFREALDFEGGPITNIPHRSRVQGRQMYVFGHATQLGWFDGRALVSRCFQRGYAAFLDPAGGYVAAIGPDGRPSDSTRYAYEQAFALLGFAWHARIFRDGEASERAERLWRWIENNLTLPDSPGFAQAVPDADQPRSQNPHMHLLEACLNWHAVAGDPVWLDRAEMLLGLFRTYFYDSDRCVLREYFAHDLSPTLPQSHRIDVGHQAEWIWLLAWYGRVTRTSLADVSAALFAFLERHGRSPQTGLLYEEVDLEGTPLITTSRLWSATERLKAQLVLYEAGGGAIAMTAIEETVTAIFRYHLEANGVRRGLWMDRVDADGRPVAKNVPASTLYHLFLAFAELHRVAGGGRR